MAQCKWGKGGTQCTCLHCLTPGYWQSNPFSWYHECLFPSKPSSEAGTGGDELPACPR